MNSVNYEVMEKRPYWPGWLAILPLAAAGLWMTGVGWFAATSEFGRVALLLCKAGFKLVHPAWWIGGAVITAVWLAVMAAVWRQ